MSDGPIIDQMGGSKPMGRIRPGTHLAVREATSEELAAQEKRIRALYEPDEEPPEGWVGHKWFVVFAAQPDQVLHDWFSPVGGPDKDYALREAQKYARARGAEVVEL
jgi:hypothetical protein